jgi:hypothetical protein
MLMLQAAQASMANHQINPQVSESASERERAREIGWGGGWKRGREREMLTCCALRWTACGGEKTACEVTDECVWMRDWQEAMMYQQQAPYGMMPSGVQNQMPHMPMQGRMGGGGGGAGGVMAQNSKMGVGSGGGGFGGSMHKMNGMNANVLNLSAMQSLNNPQAIVHACKGPSIRIFLVSECVRLRVHVCVTQGSARLLACAGLQRTERYAWRSGGGCWGRGGRGSGARAKGLWKY